VRGLWDAHDSEERGYLDRKELEDLLGHLKPSSAVLKSSISMRRVASCGRRHFESSSLVGSLSQFHVALFGRLWHHQPKNSDI